MEVFIRDLPPHARDDQLTQYFLPLLESLSIKNFSFHKLKRQPYAKLTLLHAPDGNRFLAKYGWPNGLQLHFQGCWIKCSLSKCSPDEFVLRNLQMREKARQTTGVDQQASNCADGGNKDLECTAVSCGCWAYDGSNPVFMSHIRWKVHGSLKFAAKQAIIRLDTPYWTVLDVATQELQASSLTFTLSLAPHLFRPISHARFELKEDVSELSPEHFGGMRKLLNSLSEMSSEPERGPTRERMPGLDKEHEKISGICFVYRFDLTYSTFENQKRAQKRARGLPPPSRYPYEVKIAQASFDTEMDRLLRFLSDSCTELLFGVKFQVQKLAQNGYLLPSTVRGLLPEILAFVNRSGSDSCVRAIRKLLQQIPYSGPGTDGQELHLSSLVDLLRSMGSDRDGISAPYPNKGQNIGLVHRVMITPSGTYLYGPDPENNNRVLRKYSNYHDFFIRAQFYDEDGDQIRYHPDISNDRIFSRFKSILNEGIEIGGRRFAFLGFSHSSLRSQSCWFMAPFRYGGQWLSDRMLIKRLGDFSGVHCPAKCAARIGQAFSETPTAIPIAAGVCKEIEDIELNKRLFSDGVGTISRFVLRQIWSALPEANRRQTTVFQIRYSGVKGMIALDSRLRGSSLNLRKSMTKFSGSDSTDIEICGATYRSLPLYLNHQVIKILIDMGIENDFFLSLQRQEIKRLNAVTSSANKAAKFHAAVYCVARLTRPICLKARDILLDVAFS